MIKHTLLLGIILLIFGCASGPSVKNESDIAQMADVATTFTALEIASGFGEVNPIMAPLAGSPIGYAAMTGVKLGINYGFRQAEDPLTCVQGTRAMTTFGWAAAASNAALLAGTGPVGLLVGIGVGVFNWINNDDFIEECELERRFPQHDIRAAWERGLLFTAEGVPK